jgi:hypothetical protein
MLELMESINKLRENLYSILEQKDYDLGDPQVIEASDDLNNAVVAYNTLLQLKVV